MKKLLKLLNWLDNNLIKLLLVGFIFLIPLYPKIPIRSITYTYVSIRIEDLYVGILYIAFLFQLLRKKVALPSVLRTSILLFWLAVFASFTYHTILIKDFPYIELAFLNALRRIEYMGIFFIAASQVTSFKQVVRYLKLILFILLVVGVYGIGQKFLGWPAVQTMNPEYAKGYVLFLTPEARVSSTFAGHYDLAAYIIFLMPLVLGFYLFSRNLIYLGIFLLSLFTLILTASRASYGSYLLSTFPYLLYFRKFRLLIIIAIFTLVLTLLSKNLTSRIFRTFQVKKIFVNEQTGEVLVPQKITTKEVPAGSLYVKLNETTSDKKNEKLIREQILTDIRNQASASGKKLTPEEENALAASLTASLQPLTTVVSDISFATRIQIEWPRAIKAFFKNPVVGAGPASLTEATDNDYLRWLGEFGLLGAGVFIYILFSIIRRIWKSLPKLQKDSKVIYLAFIFGMIGLLINSSYFDLFEASKIAYYFWLMSGLFIGSLLAKHE